MDAVVQLMQSVKEGIRQRLTRYTDAISSYDASSIRLFKNDVQVDVNTTLANLVECDFSGYSPWIGAGGSWGTTFFDNDNKAYVDGQGFQTFTHNGGGVGNTVYIVGLCVQGYSGTTQAAATAIETGGVITAINVTNPGLGYTLAPKVTISDDDGTGASAHAEIAGGVVTGVVIDAGGTGYTAPTVIIDPPDVLLDCGRLASPRSMSVLGDALPLIIELNETSGF